MCRIMGIAMHSEAVANQNTYSRCENRANQNSRCHCEATPCLSLPLHHVNPLSMTNQNSRCHFKATPHLSLPLRRLSPSQTHMRYVRHRGGIRSTESPPANTDQTDWRHLALEVTLIRGRRPYIPWTIGDYTIYCATPATSDQTKGLGPIHTDWRHSSAADVHTFRGQ